MKWEIEDLSINVHKTQDRTSFLTHKNDSNFFLTKDYPDETLKEIFTATRKLIKKWFICTNHIRTVEHKQWKQKEV